MLGLQSLPRAGVQLLKAGSDLVVAGYASVELVDKQGDLITKEALKNAFHNFMENPGYRNVQLAHSNIQVGEVVPNYTDSQGRVWKSEVDDVGMFVVVKLRSDIEKAREVAAEIRKGNLKGFSIGGQAFKRMNKHDKEHGSYKEISKLELHEVTICEKGINQEATFRILKEDRNMTEDNTLGQLSTVLERLEGRLDSMEKGLPPQFEKKPKKGKKDDEEMELDLDDEKKSEEEIVADPETTEKAQGGYSDVISSEYLNWLEDTVKAAGHDPTAARTELDSVQKDYGPGDDGATHAGQAPKREQTDGKPEVPKAEFGSGGKGKASTLKAEDYLVPSDVTPTDIEAAYQVYKAAAQEQQFKANLGEHFAKRLQEEQASASAEHQRAAFDAREPLAEIQKSIEALGERIDGLSGEEGEEIQKSAAVAGFNATPIPSTDQLASMSWDDVHRLADNVWRGE